MFGTAAGLLLNHTLHKTFDSLDWSLYRKVSRILLRSSLGNTAPQDNVACTESISQDETFYVHYFIPKKPEHFTMHGKAIPPDRFSRFLDPPDPRLVAWHYNQAVKARIRGFSVGMSIGQTIGLGSRD